MHHERLRRLSMAYPIIMHVNYCEQGQSIDEMCRKAVAWGYEGIEFRRKREGVDETAEAYLDEVAKAVETSGLHLPLFGGPGIDLTLPDAARRRQEVEEGIRFYRLAAERFTLTLCNIEAGYLTAPQGTPGWNYDARGSAVATEDHFQWAAEGFRELAALAEELGFRIAFETHMNTLHDLPAPTVRLLDMIGCPAVGANLDYGNMAQFQKPPRPQEVVEGLKGRIFMLHLKNVLRVRSGDHFEGIRCSLADGVINQREFLRLVTATGFEGPLVAESPRLGDREWFAQEDFHYLQFLRNELITLA
jgi:sugar phosphate isomerase/epimerase